MNKESRYCHHRLLALIQQTGSGQFASCDGQSKSVCYICNTYCASWRERCSLHSKIGSATGDGGRGKAKEKEGEGRDGNKGRGGRGRIAARSGKGRKGKEGRGIRKGREGRE